MSQTRLLVSYHFEMKNMDAPFPTLWNNLCMNHAKFSHIDNIDILLTNISQTVKFEICIFYTHVNPNKNRNDALIEKVANECWKINKTSIVFIWVNLIWGSNNPYRVQTIYDESVLLYLHG